MDERANLNGKFSIIFFYIFVSDILPRNVPGDLFTFSTFPFLHISIAIFTGLVMKFQGSL